MNKRADTSVSLHPLIADRWSPRAFDESATISGDDLAAIFEAARWAPSAFNAQPWKFIVGLRGDEKFTQISSLLVDFNKQWAPKASALILVNALTFREDGKVNPTALYDTGLAVSHLTFEANHRGFDVHQMSGFDSAAAKATFSLEAGIEAVACIAVGKKTSPDSLPDEIKAREVAPRSRKSLDEIVNITW
jgi:nitroreductase